MNSKFAVPGHRHNTLHILNCTLSPRSVKQERLSALCTASSCATAIIAAISIVANKAARADADFSGGSPVRAYQTGSGLIYVDLNNVTQSVITPKYGQFISFYYTMYYRPSKNSSLQFIDSTKPGAPFLQKHGNGRVIRGIEETLHTMTVGGRRRAILTKELGYSKFGLGPLPVAPSVRRKLGKILDFIDQDQGELVFDLELVNIRDDENDQGYYDDVPISQQEVRQMVLQSLQTSSPEFMESVKASTPPGLLKK